MNKRQRERRQARRAHHAGRPSTADRPAIVLNRETYPSVEVAHIVPRLYQRAWAVDGMVSVHREGRDRCRRVTTRKAGTRPAYYRRPRPSGEEIDDVEASLGYAEAKAARPLRELIGGSPITPHRKGTVAQFVAVQMLRGPAYFEQREELLRPILEQLGEGDLRPEAVAAAGGDAEQVRERVIEEYLGPTQRFQTMLMASGKMASILGLMHWQVLQFSGPILAFSDHPVSLWPMNVGVAHDPFARQGLGPLTALEVRLPISPSAAILMNWLDRSDGEAMEMPESAGADLNAFTIGQADLEWMHEPGGEPPVGSGPFRPISGLTDPSYDAAKAMTTDRHGLALSYMERVKGRTYVPTVDVLTEMGTG